MEVNKLVRGQLWRENLQQQELGHQESKQQDLK
jgi:hypothetical protein